MKRLLFNSYETPLQHEFVYFFFKTLAFYPSCSELSESSACGWKRGPNICCSMNWDYLQETNKTGPSKMSGFTTETLEKKLAELNTSQQSIQTLSLWLIHHRKHHKMIVQTWYKELRKGEYLPGHRQCGGIFSNARLIFVHHPHSETAEATQLSVPSQRCNSE